MKKAIYFLPPFLWCSLIFILLVVPGDKLPGDDIFAKIYFDKWVHTGLFAMQVMLLHGALRKFHPLHSPVFLYAALYAWLYGIAMEFVQKYLVFNRTFSVADIVFDGVGCLIGYLIYRRRVRRMPSVR